MEMILINAFLNLNNKWDNVRENLIINKVLQKYNNYYLCSTLEKFSCVRKTGHTTRCREHRPLGEGVQRHTGALSQIWLLIWEKALCFLHLPLVFFFALSPFPLSCLTFMFFPLLLLYYWGSKQTSKPCGLSTQVHFSTLPDHRSFWIWLLKSATTIVARR